MSDTVAIAYCVCGKLASNFDFVSGKNVCDEAASVMGWMGPTGEYLSWLSSFHPLTTNANSDEITETNEEPEDADEIDRFTTAIVTLKFKMEKVFSDQTALDSYVKELFEEDAAGILLWNSNEFISVESVSEDKDG